MYILEAIGTKWLRDIQPTPPRRTCAGVLRQNFCDKKKIVTRLPSQGWEAKTYMRNGFTAGFCHFLGTIKIWIKKKNFSNISCAEFLSHETLLEKKMFFFYPKHD